MHRIFIDMDGVIVDFDQFCVDRQLAPEDVKRMVGAYQEMQPMPHAIDAVRTLIAFGFDVYLATKPPTGIPHAYADKVSWVLKHLPELGRKIIITHDKGLLGDSRDFLIDDRPHRANCRSFDGTLLHFGSPHTWPDLLKYFTVVANALRNNGYLKRDALAATA